MKNYFQQLCVETHSSCHKFCLVYLKYALKIYSLVHLLPMIIFKRKELFSNQLRFLLLTVLVLEEVYVYVIGLTTEHIIVISIYKITIVLTIISIVFLSNFSVLFEDSSRVLDYTLFTLPRSVEGFWNLLEKLGYVKSFKYGSDFLFAFSIAVAMLLYKIYPDDVPKSYTRLISYIYGQKI